MTLKQMTMFGVAVSNVKNQDTVRMINAVSFPHMKEKDQDKLLENLGVGSKKPNYVKL